MSVRIHCRYCDLIVPYPHRCPNRTDDPEAAKAARDWVKKHKPPKGIKLGEPDAAGPEEATADSSAAKPAAEPSARKSARPR